MKAIFCGTPAIAVPSLIALSRIAEIVGVVCQPDRPQGRGMKTTPPAVKIAALELGLDVFQPEKVRDGTLAAWMEGKQADLALVIAYGRILDRRCLDAPRLGCLNLHASLLPKYRGAAPIQRALMNGERESGVCLMQMDEGMDTGPLLAVHRLAIEPDDNAGSLALKMSELAAEVTRVEIPRAFLGSLVHQAQPEQGVSHAHPITKQDTALDFTRPAPDLRNLVRGLAPQPGAAALLHRKGEAPRGIKLLEVRVATEDAPVTPGSIVVAAGSLLVGTGTFPLEIREAKIEGKRALSSQDLMNGRLLLEGDSLAC